jgi:3-oxoacyl-[acyl-carrier protein] reductase
MIDLSGKSALVTGGTRGIGRAIVQTLAAAGADVAFTYRSSTDAANALVAELEGQGRRALALQGDAADGDHAQEAVKATIDAFGSLDVLVNNAGITRDTLLIRMKDEDWDAVIDTNLKGAFHFCRAAYRPMMKQRAGAVINIASIVGVTGNPGQVNYAASKAGLIGLTKSLARELGGRGVTANVVAPGYVATDMTADLNDQQRAAMADQIPLGRVADAEDIAGAVLYLASPLATYVTGQVLCVDGGLAM